MKIILYKTTAVAVLLLSIFIANSQYNTEYQKQLAQKYLDERREVYFKFLLNDYPDLEEITRMVSIDNVIGDTVYAYANQDEFNKFTDSGILYYVITPASISFKTNKKNRNISDITDSWDSYPTYSEYIEIMEQFADDYPQLCSLEEIGESVKERKILCMKISDNVTEHEAETEFFYSSAMHGNEPGSIVLMLRLIDYLLTNYETDTQVTKLIDNVEIWINPLANPDGAYENGDGTLTNSTRYNYNGVDLNRNFPDPAEGDHPDGNQWQQENIVMMEFMQEHNFTLSANFHAGSELVNYPWDCWSSDYPDYNPHPDETWYQYVSHEYADTVHYYGTYSYMNPSFTDDGIINGYTWYPVYGGRQDYMTRFMHGREVTIELDYTKYTPEDELNTLWEYNYRSMLNYMEQCTFGLHGMVTDSLTGEVLKAKIEILAHDEDSSFVYSDSLTGYYTRLLYEGTYDVQVSAYGYYTKTVSGVEIINHEATGLSVELVSNYPPRVVSSDGEAVDTLWYTISDTKTSICLSVNNSEDESFSLTINQNNEEKGETDQDTGNSLCFYYEPQVEIPYTDTLQIIVADDGTPVLHDTVCVIIDISSVAKIDTETSEYFNCKISYNAASNSINIQLNTELKGYGLLTFYDITGRTLSSQQVNCYSAEGSYEAEVPKNIGNLYFVRFSLQNQYKTFIFVKE